MITTRTLTHITALSALVAAALMLQAQPVQAQVQAQAQAPVQMKQAVIVELPRVVITGKRVQPMQIVELPRVVVTVRRSDTATATTRVVQTKVDSKV